MILLDTTQEGHGLYFTPLQLINDVRTHSDRFTNNLMAISGISSIFQLYDELDVTFQEKLTKNVSINSFLIIRYQEKVKDKSV